MYRIACKTTSCLIQERFDVCMLLRKTGGGGVRESKVRTTLHESQLNSFWEVLYDNIYNTYNQCGVVYVCMHRTSKYFHSALDI